MDILLGMEVNEIKRLAESQDEKGLFVDKMDELRDRAEGLCIMDGFDDVLCILDDAVEGVLDLSVYRMEDGLVRGLEEGQDSGEEGREPEPESEDSDQGDKSE